MLGSRTHCERPGRARIRSKAHGTIAFEQMAGRKPFVLVAPHGVGPWDCLGFGGSIKLEHAVQRQGASDAAHFEMITDDGPQCPWALRRSALDHRGRLLQARVAATSQKCSQAAYVSWGCAYSCRDCIDSPAGMDVRDCGMENGRLASPHTGVRSAPPPGTIRATHRQMPRRRSSAGCVRSSAGSPVRACAHPARQARNA